MFGNRGRVKGPLVAGKDGPAQWLRLKRTTGCSGLPGTVTECWGRPGLLRAQKGWEHHQPFARRSDTQCHLSGLCGVGRCWVCCFGRLFHLCEQVCHWEAIANALGPKGRVPRVQIGSAFSAHEDAPKCWVCWKLFNPPPWMCSFLNFSAILKPCVSPVLGPAFCNATQQCTGPRYLVYGSGQSQFSPLSVGAVAWTSTQHGARVFKSSSNSQHLN